MTNNKRREDRNIVKSNRQSKNKLNRIFFLFSFVQRDRSQIEIKLKVFNCICFICWILVSSNFGIVHGDLAVYALRYEQAQTNKTKKKSFFCRRMWHFPPI